MKVLVIAPHMDDEVLGCGVAIARHVEAGDEVHTCIIAHRVYEHQLDLARLDKDIAAAELARQVLGYSKRHFLNLHDERLDACIQDIIIPLENVIQSVQPTVVYSPFCGDNNQDHRAVARASQVALRPTATPFLHKWVQYETPSSTDQTPPFSDPTFRPTLFLDASKYLATKIDALLCYDGELREFPHPRSKEGLRAYAQFRGMQAGLSLAEAHMLIRERQ